jgi:DNA-binding transcriptional ArsR family regulator
MLSHAARVDRVFQALADSTRRSIIDRLCRGPVSVSELAKPLDITLAAVVQQVQVLEQSGLVCTEKKGRIRTCRIEPRALSLAQDWIAARREVWEHRLDRLGEILAADEGT